jgi:hypothetical protein
VEKRVVEEAVVAVGIVEKRVVERMDEGVEIVE